MPMSDEDKKKATEENIKSAVQENSKWVDGVLWAQVFLGVAIIGAKVLGATTFKWNDIQITVWSAWFPFALLTLAHFYSARLLIGALKRAHENLDYDSKVLLFDKIASTGGLFVRGMIPRPYGKDRVAYIDDRDMSGYAAMIAMPLLIVAVTPLSSVCTLTRCSCSG